jgi:hypothetical protein
VPASVRPVAAIFCIIALNSILQKQRIHNHLPPHTKGYPLWSVTHGFPVHQGKDHWCDTSYPQVAMNTQTPAQKNVKTECKK